MKKLLAPFLLLWLFHSSGELLAQCANPLIFNTGGALNDCTVPANAATMTITATGANGEIEPVPPLPAAPTVW